MQYLFVVTALLGWSQILGRYVGKDFSVLGSVLFLITAFFFAAVFGQFVALSNAIGWAGAVYAVYSLVRNAKNQESLKAFGQQALLWLVIVALARICSKGAVNWAWDEFSHWGTHVEYLRIFGELLGDPTLVLFADYIPGISLWRSFFRQQLPLIGPSAAYLADWILLLACFHTLTVGKKPIAKVTLLCIVAGIWIVFFQSLILTLYVDPTQAMLLLTGLALVSLEAPLLIVSLLIAALTSTKHVGLLFSLSIAAYYGCHALLVNRMPLRSSLRGTLSLAFCALAIWGTWALFVELNHLAPSADLAANRNEFLPAFLNSLGNVLDGKFPHAWYLKQAWAPAFSLPAYALILGSFVALAAVLAGNTDTRRHDALDLVFSMGLVALYTVFLAAVWSRIPGGADPFSYTRYLAVPLMAGVAHALWRKFSAPQASPIATATALLAIALGGAILAPPPAAMVGEQKPGLAAQREYQHIVEGVRKHTKLTDTIFYLIEPEHVRNYFVFRSAVMPQHLASWKLLTDVTLKRGAENWPALEARRELLAAELCNSPYIYAGQLSQVFWEDYQMLFDTPENESLYETQKSDSGKCSARLIWSADPAYKAP